MSLIDLAAADLRTILSDTAGFARPMTVTSPSGLRAVINGLYQDVHVTIDPETGQAVSGRVVTAALSLRDLAAAKMETPKAVSETTRKPWTIEVADAQGVARYYKVSDSQPDELGCVVCHLENYK